MSGADAKLGNALGPVMLVIMVGNNDLRRAGSGGGGSGARSPMVDDGSNSFEQELQVDLTYRHAVGFVIDERQVGPASGDNRAASERAGRLDHDLAEICRRANAAEAKVDGWVAVLEERLQLS